MVINGMHPFLKKYNRDDVYKGDYMIGELVGGLGSLLSKLFILVIIFVPLGMWKLVELIIWAIKHIRIISQ